MLAFPDGVKGFKTSGVGMFVSPPVLFIGGVRPSTCGEAAQAVKRAAKAIIPANGRADFVVIFILCIPYVIACKLTLTRIKLVCMSRAFVKTYLTSGPVP
jgi:hypothetical protein